MKKLIPPHRTKFERLAAGPRFGLPGMFLGFVLGGLACGTVFWLKGIHWVWVGIPVAGWIGYAVRKDVLTPGRNPRPPNVIWGHAKRAEETTPKTFNMTLFVLGEFLTFLILIGGILHFSGAI